MNRMPSHIGRRWSNGEREEEEKERKGKHARDAVLTDRITHTARRRSTALCEQIYGAVRRKTRRQLRARPPYSGLGEKISWQKIEDKNADAKIKKLLYCHCNNNSIKIPLKCNE